MVLVDSSVWIEAARREGALEYKVGLEGLLEAAEACVCESIKLEVLGDARSQDRKRMATYFECIPYRPMDENGWEFAMQCAWRLRDKGHSLPWNDILIGSLSVRWECRVYAKDQDFEIMREVIGVRLYKTSYGGSFAPDR